MRWKSDEIKIFEKVPIIKTDRELSIISKLQSLGLMTEDCKLTKRGLHVAAALKTGQEQNGSVQRSDGAGVASESRSGDSGRDQAETSDRDCEPPERSDVAVADGPDETGGSDAPDLSGPDSDSDADSGAVRETPSVSSRRNAGGGRRGDR